MKAARAPYSKVALALLFSLNLIGLTQYLRFASLVWAPRGQEGLLGGPGDPIIWVLSAVPWLVACSLMNLLAFRTICARLILAGRWVPALILVSAVAAWVAAFEYDSSRHYNGGALRIETSTPASR